MAVTTLTVVGDVKSGRTWDGFTCKLGSVKLLESPFKINDTALLRHHKDDGNLWQVIYQILGAYFEDDCADELIHDPVLTAILDKNALASQPTLSRFFNRMDETTLNQFYVLMRRFRKVVYAIKRPQLLLLDFDSTLLDTCGHQEGEGFNFHYQSHVYHLLVCYDGMTGDLLKIELRNDTDYSSTGIVEFLQPLLDEFLTDYPQLPLRLRGDSGFAKPELYEIHVSGRIMEVSTPCCMQSGSAAVEKPMDQLIHMYMFIVTNMNSAPDQDDWQSFRRGLCYKICC